MRTFEPLHVAPGGELHAIRFDGYEHAPPPQLPGALYVRRVVEFAQSAPGGVVHETPAHGSGLQAPFAQPNGHVLSLVV